MKETLPITQDQIQQVKQAEVRKQVKKIGSMLPGDGHICFEFDKVTNELRRAKFEDVPYVYQQKELTRKTVKVRENCFYVTALNAKNAVKKIQKRFTVPFVVEVLKDEE